MRARSVLAFALLLLGGCAQDEMDGARSPWTANSKQNQSNSFVGFACTAVASPKYAASGETVTVEVTPYNAAGTVSIPGIASSSSASGGISFSTGFTNSAGVDVAVSRSVRISDGTSQTSCTFSVIVRGQPGRVL